MNSKLENKCDVVTAITKTIAIAHIIYLAGIYFLHKK
jgi:hypothetical protein